MWWLKAKSLISGTAIKYLAVGGLIIAVISGIFFLGFSQGQERGFSSAYSEFKEDVSALDNAWRDAVDSRDIEITNLLSSQFELLDQQIQAYIRNDERERELISRLDVLSLTLQEMRDESETTDFGICEFSPEFERLLNDARDSITRPATN